MQAQSKSGPGGSLSTLYGGLNDFSSLLTNALGTIDGNVNTLYNSNANNQEQIDILKSQVEKYGIKLKNLEAEAEEQRSKLEKAMLNVTDMGKNIDSQLSETTKQMHRELLTQRTSTKMDLFTLGGNIRKSMNEAMDLIAESPKLLKSSTSTAHNPASTNEESIKYLLDKIKVVEEALMIQHNVNVQLSESVKNDEMVRKIYDSLYDQISHLESALHIANTSNQELKEKYHRDIEKVRETQTAQQDQISQLVGALLSAKNMKKFKARMSRNSDPREEDLPRQAAPKTTSSGSAAAAAAAGAVTGASTASSGGAGDSATATAEEKEGALSAEDDEEGEDEEEERPRKRDRERRRRRHRRRRHSDSESDEEDAAAAGEEGGDRFDEAAPGRHGTVKTRHHHHHHHHHTTKETVVKEVLVPVPGAAAAPAATPAEDFSSKSESGKRKPTELNRKKTFSSTVKEEKETQTPKADAASVSTNTDKPHAPAHGHGHATSTGTSVSAEEPAAAPPAPNAPAPSPIVVNGKIVFDDEGAESAREQKEEYGQPLRRQPSGDSLDGSYSYYDSDSYYSVSIRGGVTVEQLEKVAAEAKSQVEELRAEYTKRTDELAESVLTFKRIALILEDMKINYDLLKNKVDSLGSGAGGSGGGGNAGGNFDEMRTNSQYNSIQTAKVLWTKVHGELLHGLEKFSEIDSELDEENTAHSHLTPTARNSKLFLKKAAMLVGFLDNSIAAFHPAETVAATLKAVHPTLENIYRNGLELDALDDQIRQHPGFSEGASFDTLVCTDQTHNLKTLLRDAMAASVPVLDESIPKVAMRQRLEQLEKALKEKVDKSAQKAMQEEIKNLWKAKVDIKDFQATTSKLATAAELAKLNLYVADIGGRGSAAGYSNARVGEGSANVEHADLQKNADFQSLLLRFDMLGKQQLDLHNFCGSFVPREEVHEAMKAVIAEVKALKQSTVNHTLFRDGLKTKADTAEVERVVKAITEAVGDLNIHSADAAAAIHAKCLICDKPVTVNNANVRARTAAAGGKNRGSSLVSSSMPMLGYSKAMDDSSVLSANEHDKQMFNRLTSNNPAVSQNERVKVATELAILRSSIDPLPEINDPSNNFTDSSQQSGAGAGHYKQRIRHSAGGGVGPNYKKDTR